jgi:hypothetical protein
MEHIINREKICVQRKMDRQGIPRGTIDGG